MRRFFCILMCLSMASMALALSITNPDFENQYDATFNADIVDWYDYGGPDLDTAKGPFFLAASVGSNIFGSKCVYMGNEANTDEDGGNHTYVYQSIGTYEVTDPRAVEIDLDWGLASGRTGGEMGITVMILESDGTFSPCEFVGADCDIYGFVKTDENPDNPITEIGRGSALRYAAPGVVMHDRFQIDLTDATIGNELFLRFNNFEVEGGVVAYLEVDNITLSPAAVLQESPSDGAVYVLTERTSSENDLVFTVVDDSIISVDVLFGTDPNFPTSEPNSPPDDIIVEDMSVTQGPYTITLETELTEDLEWSTEYFWKVLAYESDGLGGRSFRSESLVRSFTTIQYGPLLGELTPKVQAVWPGEDAVFSVPFSLKADTFQWYKEGDPNPLVNGSMYSGVDSNSLTVLDAQTVDEGIYYLIGKETATGETIESTNRGELAIKELKTYYKFDTTYENGGAVYTPDEIGDKDVQLMGGASVVNSPSDPNTLFDGYLSLHNPRGVTHTQYATIADTKIAYHRDITISCWVKPTILDLDFEQYARVFDFGQDNENYFFLTMLEHSNTASCHMTEDDPDDQHAEGIGEIGYGAKWIYVVLTIEEEPDEETEEEGDTFFNGKLFINGQFGGEDGLYSPADIPTTLNYIGKAIGAPDEGVYPNFNGLIDEFKIYNYAKTVEEIAQEYMDFQPEIEFICNMDAYDLEDLDYDDNCRINFSDLVEIVERWLQNYLVYSD